jgi:hypothetical protein
MSNNAKFKHHDFATLLNTTLLASKIVENNGKPDYDELCKSYDELAYSHTCSHCFNIIYKEVMSDSNLNESQKLKIINRNFKQYNNQFYSLKKIID